MEVLETARLSYSAPGEPSPDGTEVGETGPVDRGLELGRRAYERAAWGDAYAHLSAADRETPLDLDDLERLAAPRT